MEHVETEINKDKPNNSEESESNLTIDTDSDPTPLDAVSTNNAEVSEVPEKEPESSDELASKETDKSVESSNENAETEIPTSPKESAGSPSHVEETSEETPDESSTVKDSPAPETATDSTDTVQTEEKTSVSEIENVNETELELSPRPSLTEDDKSPSEQVNTSMETESLSEKTDCDTNENESNPVNDNKSDADKDDQVSEMAESVKSPNTKDDGNTTSTSDLVNSPAADADNKAIDVDESDNTEENTEPSTNDESISENHFVECESYRNPDENDTDVDKSIESRLEQDVLAQTEPNTDESAKSTDDEPTSEPTEFLNVTAAADSEADESNTSKDLMEVDPIASDDIPEVERDDDRELDEVAAPVTPEGQGENEELCIIPDTERVISQAEKEAASALPPLRDIAETIEPTAETFEEPPKEDGVLSDPIIIHKYQKDDLQFCSLENCTVQKKVDYCYNNKEGTECYICDANCLKLFKTANTNVKIGWEEISLRVKDFSIFKDTRLCKECKKPTGDSTSTLTWEIMDFCNELCLTKYQKEIGSNCANCRKEVISSALGKYCVRFGNDVRQFCSGSCLEDFKKDLKVCSYCQQDMSTGAVGFLAPVGDKGHFKDFCSHNCMEKYDIMTNNRPPTVEPGTLCNVCKDEAKSITIEYELKDEKNYFCSEPCFVAFCFVNGIQARKCSMCKRNVSEAKLKDYVMYYDNVPYSFCSNSCQNIYIIAHRKIVPCSWCKVKKYNFDMIRRFNKIDGTQINMCSVNCLTLYQVSINAATNKRTICDYCKSKAVATYSLTMSDATIRNFCTYSCVMDFQRKFTKPPITMNVDEPIPTGNPQRVKRVEQEAENNSSDFTALPVITNVQSLATNGDNHSGLTVARRKSSLLNDTVQIQVRQHYIVRPAPIPDQRNVGTMCGVRKAHKSFVVKPSTANKECQTDEREAEKILIPVPVPIYVPTPLHMFSTPVPFPVPFPIPVPVPIFIPTTRNSATGILKEIKKIQVKIPTDPYEAELLMMAEMVAGDKKEENHTDSESDIEGEGATGGDDGNFSPEPDATNSFGDDMLQMALKMATEMDEPAVDLEGALTANTITAQPGSEGHDQSVDDNAQQLQMIDRQSMRGRKRGQRQSRGGGGAKRGRRSHNVDLPIMTQSHPQPPPPPPEPIEKPDANMCLKYTFGVNAWKQWVTTKNTELEKSSRRVKLFKTEILQLTADELNYSLCLFVKEVRKPNGAEYAPDTIYYLCLGIQQYLFENGRIDNIFCDPYYEKFTDCLDEVARKFSVLYNDSHYIVTRVEEEHLWESKQLGAHSPHVLLSTLMFFNTKHFNLTSVDEHMQLSFSHIMKHWKRNPNQPGASKLPGSRNVLLRFYPPQSAIQNNARKKKVYEQQENEENPLRCPVKLYEFYLSKCPESVKTRNDVFYLQPERSCVPDSPVWYSTMPLPRESLEKMLHRVKMVKEINVALLTS